MTNFTVTTLNDELDDILENGEVSFLNFGGSGDISLREAIALASVNPGADTISFASGFIGQTITLTNGNLVVNSDLTINGDINNDDKADITIDANMDSRAFFFSAPIGTTITTGLNALKLINGDAGAGGAVSISGTFSNVVATISNSTISNNTATEAGAIENFGNLTIINSTISNNSTGFFGPGAIRNRGGAELSLINSTVVNNETLATGGAISNASVFTITNSTITGNNAGASGEAIINLGGSTLTLNNSLIVGNGTGSDISGGAFTNNNSIVGGNAADFFVLTAPGADGSTLGGVLGDNGGSVLTVALLGTSAAINGGDNSLLPVDFFDLDNDGDFAEILPLDARGLGRLSTTIVDIGAVEFQQSVVGTITAGDDTIFGTDRNDVIDALGGSDQIFGLGGRDLLTGNAQNDILDGGAGADTLGGNLGRDSLTGGDGNDLLLGGNRQDTLNGDNGDDRAFGGNGDDIVFGGDGIDIIRGGSNNDTLDGGAGDDFVFGGTGIDIISGGDGNDILSGLGGFDTLNGGSGNDTITGGFNADRFEFDDGFGEDVITDFASLSNAERIDLSNVSEIVDFADLVANHLTQNGSDAFIDDGEGNTITLIGVSIVDLNNEDFLF